MGAVYGGIPKDLALKIRNACECKVFIETGTFHGETTVWAAEHFKQVVTVEIDSAMFESTALRLSEFGNIDARLGDSREILSEILPSFCGQNPLIWLDAHACGEEDKDSPLLEELELINKFCPNAAILIDDARFILAPVDGRRLCTLDSLVYALDCARLERYLVILDDIVMAVPLVAKGTVDAHCREVSLAAWDLSQSISVWRRSLRGRVVQRLKRLTGYPGK